jgi:hypothetical protein
MDTIILSQLKELTNSLTRLENLLLNLQEILTKIAIKVYDDKK